MSTSQRLLPRLLAACSVALALTACQSDESDRPPQGRDDAALLTTPQVIGVARAINLAEIEQATAVQGRLTDPAARRFSEQMIRDHNAGLERLSTLTNELTLAPEDSELCQDFVRKAQEVMQRLNAAVPADLDHEYLDSQVVMHERALDVIDNRLIPVVTDERLRQELTEMRGQVATHLEQARQLSSK